MMDFVWTILKIYIVVEKSATSWAQAKAFLELRTVQGWLLQLPDYERLWKPSMCFQQ